MPKNYKKMFSEVSKNLQAAEFGTDTDVAKYATSFESMDNPEMALEELTTAIGLDEDTSASAKAGAIAAAATVDVEASFGRKTVPSGAQVVNHFDSTHHLTHEEAGISLESFTGKNPEDVAPTAYVFNYGASKQNDFAEAFFPTVIKPTGTAAVKVGLTVDYIMNEFSRNDGKDANTKANMISLVKAFGDSDGPLGRNGNTLTPVSDISADFDEYFVKALESDAQDVSTQEAIKTAPLAVGKTIPLLDVSQTKGMLARGTMDHTDTLDPSAKVVALYAEVGGETYKINTAGVASNTFTFTPQGDGQDIQLLMNARRFALRVADLTQADGTPQTQFAAIPAGSTVVYDLVATGTGNAVEGHVSLYVNKLECVAIYDAAGNQVVGAAYTAQKADADKLAPDTVKGYDLEAYVLNDNIRRAGHLITRREKSAVYPLLPATPFTVQAPAANLNRAGSDADIIPSLIKDVIHQVNMNAVLTIAKFATYMRTALGSSVNVADIDTVGVARHVIDPYFKSLPLDLSKFVDSVSSATRTAEINATIINNIRLMVGEMIGSTGYGNAVDGERDSIDIVVGCDETIGSFLGGEIDLGAGRRVKVVTSRVKAVRGKVWVAFGNFSTSANEDVDPLNFGNFCYVPTLVGKIPGGSGTSSVTNYTVHPVYQHIINTPILGELVVTGLEASIGKITMNQHTI